MKRLLVFLILMVLAVGVQAQYQGSVETQGFDNQATALALVSGNPRGSVIPVAVTPDYFGTQRITWMAVRPYTYNLYNDEDLVQTANTPPTGYQNCYYACPNNTVYVCHMTGISSNFSASNYDTLAEREAAWAALPAIMKGYSAKLALPFGQTVRYVILKPEAMYSAGPSVVCP